MVNGRFLKFIIRYTTQYYTFAHVTPAPQYPLLISLELQKQYGEGVDADV